MDSNQQENKQQEYYQLFQHWRHTIGYCYQRRFLEAHPVLVGPALEHLSSIEELRQSEDFELLQRIHQRGGSIEAIREVYVDCYGGLALDLPSWLEKLEDKYNDLLYSQPPYETVEQRILLLQEAIKRSQDDEAVAPETLADLCNKLAIALKHYGAGEYRAIESAIALHEVALSVFQFERYPRQWAMQQANLGTAYAYRVAGEKRSNIEKAIAHFKSALQVYTPLNPREYATILTNLGVAYQDRIEGDPRENIEASLQSLLAALRIRTRKAFPASHAATLDKLGSAYHQRLVGSQRQNKEKAISCYQAALSIYESKHLLADQAMVLSNLGLIYRDRVAGLRSENLEQSIRYFEKALAIYTPQSFPHDWALAQLNLGVVYTYRLRGTRRDNLEEAIAHLERSLQVLSMEQSRLDYGDALNSLGNVYKVRISGDRRENLEQAVKYFTQALQIRTRESLPEAYAATQNNLGGTYWYLCRLPGRRSQSIEDAIHAYTEALQIYTREKLPNDYAMTQGNLGVAYYSRLIGDPSWNQEEAIKCFQEALQIYTPVEYPSEYATMQDNLGLVYWRRVKGDRQTNLATALACHMKALDTYTPDDFPLENRNVHLNIASLAFEEMIPYAQKSDDRQQLHAACTLAQEHYALARQTQLMLGWLESDEQGRASLQGFHFATREMYAREAWCLWTLGRLQEAAMVLEAGRAQALTEAQLLGGVALEQVCPEHTAEFEAALQEFQRARLEGDRVQMRATRDEFLCVKKAIQEHCQPDFLPDLLRYQEITNAAAADQTVIYLATAQYGGFALIIPQANDHPDGPERSPIALSLPNLTWETVDEWITTHAQQGGVIGGYKFALRRQGLELLLIWLIAEDSQEEYERRVATPLSQIKSLLPDESTPLRLAMTDTLATLAQINGDLAGAQQADTKQTLDLPLDTWLADKALRKLLQQHLAWNLQKRAITCLLCELSTTIMEPLRQYLDELGLTARDQRLAFIPCGRLGIFPLHAAPVGPEQLPFAETCEITYQASARVLTAVRAAALALPAHGAVLAVGGPQHAGSATLPCAEAEAEAIVRVARQARRRASVCLRGVQATKALFLKKLADIRQTPGAWLHLASHGRASVNDPHESYMELSGFDAQGKKARLTLAILQRERLLVGIWGVTASGCVTGLNDLELAPDELGSFAAGLLQAGAVCVVATLWSVKDHATALLMVRFHELRINNASLTAAAALREAVYWLRTATRSQLDAFARAQRLPELSAIDPVRDAMRGSDLTELPQDSSTELAAFAHHVSKETVSPLISLPYNHPVYWAAPIIYGV